MRYLHNFFFNFRKIELDIVSRKMWLSNQGKSTQLQRLKRFEDNSKRQNAKLLKFGIWTTLRQLLLPKIPTAHI